MQSVSKTPSMETRSFWIFAHREPIPGSPGNPTPCASTPHPGKWLLFFPTSEIDMWWERVRVATVEGRLGPVSKVSTARANPNATDPNVKVICVFTRDHADRADVMRVRDELRAMGITWKIPYKTDEATRAGLYAARGHVNIALYHE